MIFEQPSLPATANITSMSMTYIGMKMAIDSLRKSSNRESLGTQLRGPASLPRAARDAGGSDRKYNSLVGMNRFDGPKSGKEARGGRLRQMISALPERTYLCPQRNDFRVSLPTSIGFGIDSR